MTLADGTSRFAIMRHTCRLISSSDQERLRESFAAMTRPVRLLFFTQTLDCETCLQTRQILDELPPLSDQIAIEEVNLILDS